MNCKVNIVPLSMLDTVWSIVAPHLQLAVDIRPLDITLEGVKKRLYNNEQSLLTISNSAGVVAAVTFVVSTMDTGRKTLDINMLGGSGRDLWQQDFLLQIDELAKLLGCYKVRGMGARPGWTRKTNGMYDVESCILERTIEV